MPAGQPAGQHLMRVRLTQRMFDLLKEAAEDETARLGTHVTVSEIVRNACLSWLQMYERLREIMNLPPETLEELEELLEEFEEEDPVRPGFFRVVSRVVIHGREYEEDEEDEDSEEDDEPKFQPSTYSDQDVGVTISTGRVPLARAGN